MVKISILALLVHAHCTAAFPSLGSDCRDAIGIGSNASPAMTMREEEEEQQRRSTLG